MARITDVTPQDEADWSEWLASRPDSVRAVAERFDPWSLYQMKSTGHRVTIYSFSEPDDENGKVTLTVDVTGEFNAVIFDRRVFGIDPNDLEPCELPSADAVTGAMLSTEQVEENIDALRVAIRPDLWEMDGNGAVRKKN